MKHTNCPVCGSTLSKAGHTLFCKCGWHQSGNKKQQMTAQKQIAKNIFIAGLALMGTVIYVGNWGSSSLKIAPLKARQWTGSLSEKSFASLKTVCMSLKKYDCVESAHKSFFKSSGRLEVLEQLGEFQYRRHKFNEAGKTYSLYFSNKGRGVKPAYNYARILERGGDKKSALSYYKYALRAKPGVVQVSVMRSYIDLLVKSGQKRIAQAELFKLKPVLSGTGSLVKQEYDRLQKQVI